MKLQVLVAISLIVISFPRTSVSETVASGAESVGTGQISTGLDCLAAAKRLRRTIQKDFATKRFESELRKSAELIRKIKGSMDMNRVAALLAENERLEARNPWNLNRDPHNQQLKHMTLGILKSDQFVPALKSLGLQDNSINSRFEINSVFADLPVSNRPVTTVEISRAEECLIKSRCDSQTISLSPRRGLSISASTNGLYKNGIHASLTDAANLTREDVISLISRTPMSSQCSSSLNQMADRLAGVYPFEMTLYSPFDRDEFGFRFELDVFGHGASLSNPLDKYLVTNIANYFDLSILRNSEPDRIYSTDIGRALKKVPLAKDIYVDPGSDEDMYVGKWPFSN